VIAVPDCSEVLVTDNRGGTCPDCESNGERTKVTAVGRFYIVMHEECHDKTSLPDMYATKPILEEIENDD